ncbi:MAG: 16S rRNA (guanine(966)-N(2))-methyltransferase RsmD [Thermoanaerobaculia bacterium]
MKPAGLRIGAGELRGRRLEVPAGIRPSEGKIKEALFSIWGEALDGTTFLDLFAGSGAVGIEAVSRGALHATFVEMRRQVAGVLKRNLQLLPPSAWRLRVETAESALVAGSAAGTTFDLVFVDPPYRHEVDAGLLEPCASVLAPDGRIAVEHDARSRPPAETTRLVRVETRRYGESALSFYARG